MNEIPASTQLLCQQCTAPLPVEQGMTYITCEFCGTVNYLDKSQSVMHFAVQATLDSDKATAALRRWMAGNDTVKGLDRLAQIEPPTYQLFPVWLVRSVKGDQEKVYIKPAAAFATAELGKVTIPASDLVPYDSSLDAAAIQPTVPLNALHTWLATDEGVGTGEIREVSLVHVPVYLFRYAFQGKQFAAMVDGAIGRVFASVYPEKNEIPYVSIAGFGCVAYFLAALIPIITYAVMGSAGVPLGMLIYVGVAIVLALPIFAAAARITQKY